MSTYTQIHYHLIFSTKERSPVLDKKRRPDLFGYIWGILKNLKCHTYRINGVEDHLHIHSSLHPTVCLADLVKAVKTSTNTWIKSNGIFRRFSNWQDGYGAFTIADQDKDDLIRYIINQEEHHRSESFLDEYRRLLTEAGIEFKEEYLW